MEKNEKATGIVSLILFGLGMILAGLTTIMAYLSKNEPLSSDISAISLLVSIGFIFCGIPILLASLITSIICLIRNRHQKIGYIVLTGNILVGTVIILSLFK